jgi:hypothetical protein
MVFHREREIKERVFHLERKIKERVFIGRNRPRRPSSLDQIDQTD